MQGQSKLERPRIDHVTMYLVHPHTSLFVDVKPNSPLAGSHKSHSTILALHTGPKFTRADRASRIPSRKVLVGMCRRIGAIPTLTVDMPSSRTTARKSKNQVLQPPTPPSQDEDVVLPDFEQERGVDVEKDETERELERLVFGDAADFREAIQSFKHHEGDIKDTSVEVGIPEKEDDEAGLEGVSDADVCSTPRDSYQTRC